MQYILKINQSASESCMVIQNKNYALQDVTLFKHTKVTNAEMLPRGKSVFNIFISIFTYNFPVRRLMRAEIKENQ